MKLREFFTPGRTVSRLGSTTFRPNLMKEVLLTPHERMSRVLDMLETRPGVVSGLKKYINYVISTVKFKSTDAKSVEFMTEWLAQRETSESSIKTEIYNFAYLLAASGNSYLEITYTKDGIIDNFFHLPDPSVIYYNLDEKDGKLDDDKYWLMEVPIDVRSFRGMTPTYYNIYYIRGSTIARKRVYAIPLSKNKIVHNKIGWTRDGYYGQGFLSSAIDNDDILREILKNWALISKYMALGKKLIGVYNENGEPVDPTELDDIEMKFRTLEEEESMFINKKFQADSLSFVGENDAMSTQVDWLVKDTGSGLVPNYLTAFSQDNALATAEETKNPFMLDLLNFQDTIQRFFNELLLSSLRKKYSFLADDLSIELGEPDIYSRTEKFAIMAQLYNMRAATFNELREAAGKDAVEGGDKWGQEPPLDKQTLSDPKIPQVKSFKNSALSPEKRDVKISRKIGKPVSKSHRS